MAAAPGDEEDGDEESVLALVKSVPGNVSLESMLTEIRKLRAVRAVGLPAGLFADVAPKVLAGWRPRAVVESPSHLRRRSPQISVDAAGRAARGAEAGGDRQGEHPVRRSPRPRSTTRTRRSGRWSSRRCRRGADPAGAGDEFKSQGPTYRRTVKTTLKASYTNHYRAGLIKLLSVLEFRSNNTMHRPVLDALELIGSYAGANLRYYPLDETDPRASRICRRLGGAGVSRPISVGGGAWCGWCMRSAPSRPCGISCGARRSGWWAPTSGATRRRIYRLTSRNAASNTTGRCANLWIRPSSSTQLREEMRTELDALHAALPKCSWLEIAERRQGPIKLTPLPPVAEPRNLRRLKSRYPDPLGCGAADRHPQGDGATHRLPARADLGCRPRHPAGERAG